ncbi:MAG: IS66 family insertion sequence element accessory protein TnpB [Chryseolinea sp.]
MLSLSSSCRYFLYRHPTDMRKGFDGLSGLVRDGLQKDPLSGDVFIFFNKRRSQVKLLLWERDGFSMYYKRLEQGTYELPLSTSTELKSSELMLILQGISLKSVRRRKRFDLNENNFDTSPQTSFVNG